MIRLLRAFGWLRWRLFVNGLRARRRDSLEQVSRVSRLLVGAILIVSFVPGSILLAVLAFIGGRGLAEGDAKALPVLIAARAILAIVTIVITISPILRFGGAAQWMTRLTLLPIPRGMLFATELAAQLADPWILVLIPALVTLPAGLASGGDVAAAAWAALAGALVLLTLASLACAASLVGALVFRHRRLGEMASVGLLIGITLVAYLPVLRSHGTFFDHVEKMTAEQRRAGSVTIPLSASKHPWLAGAPWELYARTIEASVGTGGQFPLLQAAELAAAGLLFAGLGAIAFARLMNAPGERRARGKRGEERIRRFPSLTPASSAVARSFFRLITRSVRGRVILFTAPLPAFLFAYLWRGKSMGILDPAYTGVLVLAVAGILAQISMMSFQCDQFAVDRAGLTLTFLTPATGREIVFGKAAGGLAAFAIPVGIGTIAAVALHPRGSPAVWIGAIGCVFAAYLAQSPFAALMAAWFPAPFDLSRLRGGNPHPLASILSSVLAVLVFALCGGIFAATLAFTQRPLVGLGAAIVVLASAATFSRWAMGLVGRVLDARRENLAMMAQGR